MRRAAFEDPEQDFGDAKARALLEVVRLAFEGGIGIDEPAVALLHTHGGASGERGRTLKGSSTQQPKAKRSSPSASHREAGKLLIGGPCQHCSTTATPQWRRPRGTNKLLCNACGIFYTRYGRLPEQRCAGQAPALVAGERPPAPAAAEEPQDASAQQQLRQEPAAAGGQGAAPASKRSKSAGQQQQPKTWSPGHEEAAMPDLAAADEAPSAPPAVEVEEAGPSGSSTAIIALPTQQQQQQAGPACAATSAAVAAAQGAAGPAPIGIHVLQPASGLTLPAPFAAAASSSMQRLLLRASSSSQPINIPQAPSSLAAARAAGPRTSLRQAKRRERRAGADSDDSNVSTDSQALTQLEAGSSHEDDERGHYIHPRRSAEDHPNGRRQQPQLPLSHLKAPPLLLLPPPPADSPRGRGDSGGGGNKPQEGLQEQPSSGSVGPGEEPAGAADGGKGGIIYLHQQASRGPRSRSVTPGSSYGS